MSLNKLKFTEIETKEIKSGFNHKYWDGDYELDGEKIPLDITITEYAGDNLHDMYFSVDIRQGSKKFLGDEFSSLKEAFKDAENRIEEAFYSYELEPYEFEYVEGY